MAQTRAPRGSDEQSLSLEVRCQFKGCTNDLLGTVLRRYRVCDRHLAEPVVVQDGLKQRFCRQCRKFHPLERFEGDNRNCLEKLQKHNQRRRAKRQQKKATRDEALASDSTPETPDPSVSDDKSVPASLRMEFLKLRRLQKDYHPLSSSNSLLTNSTALHQSWDPTRDGNVESNYVELRSYDGQSETNASDSPDGAISPVQLLSWSSFEEPSPSNEGRPSPAGSNVGEVSDCFRLMEEGPQAWKSTLRPHDCMHICAGRGCFLCGQIDPALNPSCAVPGWKQPQHRALHQLQYT